MSRQKIYKRNWQTICIIIENKNIQPLITKQFIWSFSYSLLLHRNIIIFTQKQYMFYLKSGTVYYIYIKQFIASAIQYNRSDKFLLRQKNYKQNQQTVWIIVKNKNKHALRTEQFFDHLFIDYCYTETIWLRHRNNICFLK